MTKKPRIKPKIEKVERQIENIDVKPKMKKRWLKRILYVFMILIFFGVGLGLMFHQTITNNIVDGYTQEYVDNTTPEEMKTNEDADVSFDPSNVGSLTSADVASEIAAGFESGNNHYTDLPVIGAIAIPDLGLNLPVIKGLDNASLAVGAGTMTDGQKMGKGNYALASHSLFYGWGYETYLFSPLHRSQVGQTIYTRDAENIYVYKTTKVFVVNPEDGWVSHDSEGDGIITLVTCTDTYATQRLIVRGELERQFPISEAWPELEAYFGSNWTRWW